VYQAIWCFLAYLVWFYKVAFKMTCITWSTLVVSIKYIGCWRVYTCICNLLSKSWLFLHILQTPFYYFSHFTVIKSVQPKFWPFVMNRLLRYSTRQFEQYNISSIYTATIWKTNYSCLNNSQMKPVTKTGFGSIC